MIDLIASKIAQQEHEQRIRSLLPVNENAVWLKDDRQLSLWPIRAGIAGVSRDRLGSVSNSVRRLLSAVHLNNRTAQRRDIALKVSLKDRQG
jgi:hypothetical protein